MSDLAKTDDLLRDSTKTTTVAEQTETGDSGIIWGVVGEDGETLYIGTVTFNRGGLLKLEPGAMVPIRFARLEAPVESMPQHSWSPSAEPVKCPYCGGFPGRAYKGPCPLCPPGYGGS